jgi:hypothetical protein
MLREHDLRVASREHPDAQRAIVLQWVLDWFVQALQAVRKARMQLDLPREEWSGPAPLTSARAAARRCGEILSVLDEDASELLAVFPPKG